MKVEAGVGLKYLYSWNVCNTVRHIWNLFAMSGSLWVAWAYKYKIKNRSVWNIPSHSGSWTWKRILKMRSVIAYFLEVSSDKENIWDGTTMHRFQLAQVWETIRPKGLHVP
ncbi:hypothetical protein LINPERPRIM_LOCUS27792 [Linum perenne]